MNTAMSLSRRSFFRMAGYSAAGLIVPAWMSDFRGRSQVAVPALPTRLRITYTYYKIDGKNAVAEVDVEDTSIATFSIYRESDLRVKVSHAEQWKDCWWLSKGDIAVVEAG